MTHTLATLIQPILAQGEAPAASPGGGFGMMLPMIIVFVMMYFLMIRPQKKAQQELANKIKAIKTGDTIITAGGIHGLVTNVQERTVTVKIADNVRIKLEKSSIGTVVKQSAEEVAAGEAKTVEAEVVPAEK